VRVIELWMSEAGGPANLPEGIFELRNALLDDLAETEER